MDPERRTQLLAMKLKALIGVAAAGCEPGQFGAGAAMMVGTHAWALLEQQPERNLGAAVAWALRRDATGLTVLADRNTDVLARRAAGFAYPIEVRRIDGNGHVAAATEPLPVAAEVPAAHREWTDTIVAAGAVPVEEHGVLAGEVRGLEVCRVVIDAHTGAVRLDVGIGADDREMFQMLHGGKPTLEALTDVVSFVAAQRVPGAVRHPLNLLAQERLLRTHLIDHPELVGAQSLVPAPPPVQRPNLKDPVPCVALAEIDGRRVAVVCSSGVDLDVVPFAIDVCSALGVDEALIVVPARDALPIQHRIAAAARATITVLGLDAVA